MDQASWPPPEESLAWRPALTAPTDSVPVSDLTDEGADPPGWLAIPDGVEPDEYDDFDVPAYALAYVEIDAGRPGGGGFSAVYALPTTDGDLRIVITNDDEIPFASPIDRLARLPTLGELLRRRRASQAWRRRRRCGIRGGRRRGRRRPGTPSSRNGARVRWRRGRRVGRRGLTGGSWASLACLG